MSEIKVKAELCINEESLLKAYFSVCTHDVYTTEVAISHEMHWVNDSGIALRELEITEGKVNAVLFVDEDTLREKFIECNTEDDYSFEDAFNTEMHWVSDSGITLGEFEIVDDKEGECLLCEI